MEPDLEFIPLQSLQVLNNSLVKMRAEAIMRLHALQKTNHDLLTENARLRQHAREAIRRQQKRAPATAAANDAHSEGTKRSIPQHVAAQKVVVKPISINVQLALDFTATIEMRISMDQYQLRDYFQADPSQLQYTMIVIETKHGIVENASTIVTRNNRITLRKLQNEMLYHITAHCTVPDTGKRLSCDTKFIYHQRNATMRSLQEGHGKKEAEAESPISVNQQKYTLNVQIAEQDYLTCSFTESEDPTEKGKSFIEQHKLKPVLLEGLVKAMQQLMESNVTITSVDVADLL